MDRSFFAGITDFCSRAGFKWEKFCIKRLYSRPKRPWNPQKAGLTFTVFYSLTYLTFGVSALLFFYFVKTFPKDCALQDEFVGLCLADTYDAASETCELDAAS